MKNILKSFIVIIFSLLYLSCFISSLTADGEGTQERERLRVKIVSPQPNSFPKGPTEIIASVTAHPSSEIERVDFYIDEQLVFTDNTPPYQYLWHPPAMLPAHTILVLAFDKQGNFAQDTITVGELKMSYKVETDLVAVHVTVTDSDGNFVRNLAKDDFIIKEDGMEQKITNFSREDTPLSLSLLMDISSSMIGERIERAQESALQLIHRMVKGENKAMIMSFDDKIYLQQYFTSELVPLSEAITFLAADGGTALYDAIAHAVRKLRPIKGKKAIILLSDGDDTDSNFDFDVVLDYCKQSDILIYSVGLQRLTFSQTFRQTTDLTLQQLRRVAEISGGKAYFPGLIDHLNKIYDNIGRELESQYSLGYISNNRLRDGTWRSISVMIKNRPDLTARARQGYYAPSY